MDFDIQSISFVLSITISLQVIILVAQYLMNKTHSGLGLGALGSVTIALGFTVHCLQETSTIGQFDS
jgi:hypothetical protein